MQDRHSAGTVEGQFLNVASLFKSFGGLDVIYDLSFSLNEGQILGVIGPNGSGKTTLFNLLTGFLKPEQGSIRFLGQDITNKRPSHICRAGIARTFQLVKPFAQLTTLENVTAGRSFGRQPSKGIGRARAEANELLDFVGLGGKRMVVAGQLGLVDRKKLEIARALATKPVLLLLDEVFAGLNPTEIEEALGLIVKIKALDITLMIVEHVMKVILGVSDRVIVLSHGEKIFEGLPEEALDERKVVEAYLGEDFHA